MSDPLGLLTARALRGVWREQPPTPQLSPTELAHIAPHLLASACSGLAWRAIAGTPSLAETSAGSSLRDAARLHLLQAGLHDLRLDAVLALADDLGLEPILVKGWTLARRYPARGLRPYGDVDLVLPAPDGERMRAVLDARPHDDRWVDVDLDHAFLRADRTPVADLWERSVVDTTGPRPIRRLGPEDELRLVAIHYVRAGGHRALSLVDVALLLEHAPPGLDWDLVLPRRDARRRGWVRAAAGLAEDLLGADLSATPLAGAAGHVPNWLREHVLTGFGHSHEDRRLPPALTLRTSPRSAIGQLRDRWPPDPLEVLIHYRRRVRPWRPIGTQVLDALVRGAGVVAPLPSPRVARRRPPRA